jgi:hypothetical protein
MGQNISEWWVGNLIPSWRPVVSLSDIVWRLRCLSWMCFDDKHKRQTPQDMGSWSVLKCRSSLTFRRSCSMETLYNYLCNVNISGLFLLGAMAAFVWLIWYFAQSKVLESVGRKDLARASRAKSRARSESVARPALTAWQSLRHAHRQSFPKSLAQAGAVGRDLDLAPSQGRQPRRAGRQGQKKASSGGSSDDGDGGSDGEPPHHPYPYPLVLNYADLANLFKIATGTAKNHYSRDPSSLPPAIHIPGCRGPSWLLTTALLWLEAHEAPASAAPVTPKRRVGRPRIAMQGKGGASC